MPAVSCSRFAMPLRYVEAMWLINGTASDKRLLHGALGALLGTPALVVTLFGMPKGLYPCIALVALSWFVSAACTLFGGLLPAIALRNRGWLGWLPLAALGVSEGGLLLGDIGALCGFVNAIIFCAICKMERRT